MTKVPPRLQVIFQRYDPPLYFITFNTYRRQKLLANQRVQDAFVAFASAGEARGIGIGRYVIMPDHIHLFARNGSEMKISQWIRLLKRELSKEIDGAAPHWQRGFFDHLVRSSESYSAKWDYVRENPVRANLVEESEAWQWQGELIPLSML